MKKDVLEFLRESNNIENVLDDLSLEQAILAWQFLNRQKTLTIKNILRTHRILMEWQDIDDKYAGQFRDCPVYIGRREAPHYSQIIPTMEFWLAGVIWLPTTKEQIKKDHVAFEKIHPFIDGNGRIGRMLMLWQTIKSKLPIKIIKEKEKFEYYKWFL